MASKKTSKKQKFSFDDMESVKLNGNKFQSHDPKKFLRDSENVLKALVECLEEGDPDSFKQILSAHLSIVNKDQFSQRAKISRRTLFRMLSEDGNPTLDNLARVFRALKAA